MEYSPKKMQKLLEDNAFGFKKKFGQNFIIDVNVNTRLFSNVQLEHLILSNGSGAINTRKESM